VPTALRTDAKIVASAFAVSGVAHLVRPQIYEPLMPPWVPRHRDVIVASGVAELACAAGLASPRTRKVAAWASAGLLVAVFPGNVHMAQVALKRGSKPYQAATVARLPFQVPMVRAMVRAAREAG
jgi:uncharacterized membrane protein